MHMNCRYLFYALAAIFFLIDGGLVRGMAETNDVDFIMSVVENDDLLARQAYRFRHTHNLGYHDPGARPLYLEVKKLEKEKIAAHANFRAYWRINYPELREMERRDSHKFKHHVEISDTNSHVSDNKDATREHFAALDEAISTMLTIDPQAKQLHDLATALNDKHRRALAELNEHLDEKIQRGINPSSE